MRQSPDVLMRRLKKLPIGEIDWNAVAEEYKAKKRLGTHGDIPVERIAMAAAYLRVTKSVHQRFIAGYFDESPSWMATIFKWLLLHPDARSHFALRVRGGRADCLTMTDVRVVSLLPYDRQPQGAMNLLKSRKR